MIFNSEPQNILIHIVLYQFPMWNSRCFSDWNRLRCGFRQAFSRWQWFSRRLFPRADRRKCCGKNWDLWDHWGWQAGKWIPTPFFEWAKIIGKTIDLVWNIFYLMFPSSWDDDPIWLSLHHFSGGRSTTNQIEHMGQIHMIMISLVGGLEHLDYFSIYISGISSSQLTFTPSFFIGLGQPPTRLNQWSFRWENQRT